MGTLPQTNRLILLALLSVLTIPANSRSSSVEACAQGVPADTVITLERIGCFGSCPEYKITISADGTVMFEGRRFVKKVGTVRSTISKEQLQVLLAAFEKINYFALWDRYEQFGDGCKNLWTDFPSAITSFRTNGKSKAVEHYYGCIGVQVLAKLEKLEQAFDDAVNSGQWIR